MKKKYEKATLECVEFADEDVITASGETNDNYGFDTPYDEF